MDATPLYKMKKIMQMQGAIIREKVEWGQGNSSSTLQVSGQESMYQCFEWLQKNDPWT